MQLENLVFDALDPQRLGRFWEAALGTEALTDAPGIYETRLAIGDEAFLDLCFQQVPQPPAEPVRLHLDLAAGERRDEEVARLLELGATYADIGQGDVPWVVLADPEGNAFCVMPERPVFAGSGPLGALPLDSADPERDAGFWAWLTGWTRVDETMLRHPSLLGPFLGLCDEPEAKTDAKNRLHLDLRLEAGEDADAVEASITERGGSRLHRPEWGEQPWRSYHDPSGNEFCVLPASAP